MITCKTCLHQTRKPLSNALCRQRSNWWLILPNRPRDQQHMMRGEKRGTKSKLLTANRQEVNQSDNDKVYSRSKQRNYQYIIIVKIMENWAIIDLMRLFANKPISHHNWQHKNTVINHVNQLSSTLWLKMKAQLRKGSMSPAKKWLQFLPCDWKVVSASQWLNFTLGGSIWQIITNPVLFTCWNIFKGLIQLTKSSISPAKRWLQLLPCDLKVVSASQWLDFTLGGYIWQIIAHSLLFICWNTFNTTSY